MWRGSRVGGGGEGEGEVRGEHIIPNATDVTFIPDEDRQTRSQTKAHSHEKDRQTGTRPRDIVIRAAPTE